MVQIVARPLKEAQELASDHFSRNFPLYKRQAGPNQASPLNSDWVKNSPSYQGQRSGNGYPSAHQTGTRRSVNITPSSELENDENGLPELLQDLLTRSSTDLTPKEQTTIAALLNKYQDVFSTSPEHIGRTNKIKHSVDTGDCSSSKSTTQEITNFPKQIQASKSPIGKFLTGEPMGRVAIDILGPLPMSKNNNRCVLVLSDLFTKWTEAYPLPDQEAKTVAQALTNELISRFGTHLQLYSDQGQNFESKLLKEVCSLLQIEKSRATIMRPQAKGSVERFNRTLVSMVKMYCQENQDCWDEFIPQLLMAYRSSKHASTSSGIMGLAILGIPLDAYVIFNTPKGRREMKKRSSCPVSREIADDAYNQFTNAIK
ncbi:unnamed protein product [Mytilus coruscus]|uniref:Integrase catalytic domain-containing protein n=1 Tax=Mytilus coruscus TaxID=42192 RepID=A0A6J8C4F0_MYTCO|nr:unnamed protein product [Mytilus coruscus]